jgi:hypothetical protein
MVIRRGTLGLMLSTFEPRIEQRAGHPFDLLKPFHPLVGRTQVSGFECVLPQGSMTDEGVSLVKEHEWQA